MTAASYSTNLTDIIDDTQTTSSTGWSALGGGASALNPGSTELFIEDTEAMTKDAFGTNRKGMIYNTGSDQGGLGTDGAYSWWCAFTSVPSLDTKAGAGFDVLIGSSASAYDHYHVFGSDTLPFGGWYFACVQEDLAGDEETGTPTATQQYFGVLADATASGAPSKGETIALDTVRGGRHDIVIEFGTTPDADADFDGVMSNLETATNRWGMMVQKEPGGPYDNSGLIQFGTSTNAVNFTDSNKVFFLRDHDHTTTNFHTWEFNNASTVANLTNIFVKALGTTSPGRIVVNDDATVNLTTCVFTDIGSFTFDANTTADRCTFIGTGLVTANEADLSGSSFLTPTAAADDAAVLWDETLSAPETISELNNCTFSQGTNNHHAITFGTGVDEDITLEGIEFTGFSSSDNVDGSTLEFLATTGSLTCTLVNCTVDGAAATSSNVGVDDAAGITVTISTDIVGTFTGMRDNSEVRVYTAGTSTELAGIENATAGSADNRSFAATIAGGTNVDYTIVNNNYEIIRVEGFSWPTTAQNIPIQQRFDRNFLNPA